MKTSLHCTSPTPESRQHAFDTLFCVSRTKLVPLLLLTSCCVAIRSQTTTFEGYPAVALSSDKLDLRLMTQGSTLASIVLKDDPEKLNPLWNPMRMARELG